MSAVPRASKRAHVEPSGFDPLKTVWDLLTNVKFALLLVGLALGAGLIGVVIPQVPAPMRGNPVFRGSPIGKTGPVIWRLPEPGAILRAWMHPLPQQSIGEEKCSRKNFQGWLLPSCAR